LFAFTCPSVSPFYKNTSDSNENDSKNNLVFERHVKNHSRTL